MLWHFFLIISGIPQEFKHNLHCYLATKVSQILKNLRGWLTLRRMGKSFHTFSWRVFSWGLEVALHKHLFSVNYKGDFFVVVRSGVPISARETLLQYTPGVPSVNKTESEDITFELQNMSYLTLWCNILCDCFSKAIQ